MLKSFKDKLLPPCLLGGLLFGLLFHSCADDDPAITRFVQNLVLEILAGPEGGSTLLNNEFFTFEWRARGGGGDVTYEIQLSGVDQQPITTAEVSQTYPGQPEGPFTFTVTARAGSESSSVSRAFSVGPNLGPPNVVITGARGSVSSGGSGVTPQHAPGKTAFLQWSGEDVDRFGEITGYRWRVTDTDPFNEFNMAHVAGFEVPATPAVYTFTLEALDNAGAVSTTTINYEVKNPTIVIVDDKPQGNVLDEIDEDKFYANLCEGFAFSTWDVAEQGVPTFSDLSPFEMAVIYSGLASTLWDDIGDDYPEAPVQLSQFVDGGGKMWVMGEGILEDLRFPAGPDNTHNNPPDPLEFEAVYLHLAAATGDTLTDPSIAWARAGANFDDFSFADDVLGDPVNFPRITIQIQDGAGDVDRIVATAGAEIIYTGKDGLGEPLGDVALRFPVGGTNTQVVFQTFPLYENRGAKASLLDSRTLTQEILREMGQ